MILLDTDHVTLLKYTEGERGAGLVGRLGPIPPSSISIARMWNALTAKQLRLLARLVREEFK